MTYTKIILCAVILKAVEAEVQIHRYIGKCKEYPDTAVQVTDVKIERNNRETFLTHTWNVKRTVDHFDKGKYVAKRRRIDNSISIFTMSGYWKLKTVGFMPNGKPILISTNYLLSWSENNKLYELKLDNLYISLFPEEILWLETLKELSIRQNTISWMEYGMW
nr:unnamed protein product [Callosobruchus chinensis]